MVDLDKRGMAGLRQADLTWGRFRAACAELESWLRARIAHHGIQFVCCPDSPGTIEDLRGAGDPVPVPEYRGRPDTIYSDGGCNKCLYQAYHDWWHQRVPGWDFTEQGELAAALGHQDEGILTGLGADALDLLWVESWVRVAYYLRWGRFPRNEALFHWICYTRGVQYALEADNV